MYRAIPAITETADTLKQLLKAERHPQKRQRLHALYLLASGQAKTRTEVAVLLGVYRETVGHWLDRYAAGGLTALLDISVPAGKAACLPVDVLTDLEQRLRHPQAFGSYDEIRRWLLEQHGIQIKYKTLANFLRRNYQTSPRATRRRYRKKR